MQDGDEKEFRLTLDDITKLIDAGREVNALIPHDVHSSEELDDSVTTIGTRVIDVLEDQSKLPSAALERKFEERVEDGELDLTPGALENTNDPVRIYLRQMGIVPLLTRGEEVDISKRIERGQLSALKALSRSPLVIRQILVIGEDLKRGIRSIKEIVVFRSGYFQAHRTRTTERAEGAFTLAPCDPTNPGHWRGFEARHTLDQGNCGLPIWIFPSASNADN